MSRIDEALDNDAKQRRTIFTTHEFFTIVYLGLLSFISIYLCITSPTDKQLSVAYYLFIGYYLFDTIWIYLLPESVPSKLWLLMLTHHTAVFFTLVVASSPEHSTYLPKLMLFEISSWLMVVRRALVNRYFLVKVLFYLAWFVVRLYIYPMLTIELLEQFYGASTKFQVMTLAMCVFCVMNVKSTYDIMKKDGLIEKD